MRESVEVELIDIPVSTKSIKELKIEEKDTRLDLIKRLSNERDYAVHDSKLQLDELANRINDILEPIGLIKLYTELKNKENNDYLKREESIKRQEARAHRNYYFSFFRPYGEVSHQVHHQGVNFCYHAFLGPPESNRGTFGAWKNGVPTDYRHIEGVKLDRVNYYITVENPEGINEYTICEECFKKSYCESHYYTSSTSDDWIFQHEMVFNRNSNTPLFLPDITSIKVRNRNKWDDTNELEPTNYYLKNFGFCFWRLKR